MPTHLRHLLRQHPGRKKRRSVPNTMRRIPNGLVDPDYADVDIIKDFTDRAARQWQPRTTMVHKARSAPTPRELYYGAVFTDGTLLAEKSMPARHMNVYDNGKLVAVVAQQPPAPPEPGPEVAETVCRTMRGGAGSPPSAPAGESFQGAPPRPPHAPRPPMAGAPPPRCE